MRDEAFAKRFNELVAAAGGPKTLHRLGPWLGVSPTMAWNYRTGEKIPGMDNARQIARRLNCCVEYLLTGRGPKRCTEDGPEDRPSHRRIFLVYDHLDPQHRAIADSVIESLLKSQKAEEQDALKDNGRADAARTGPLRRDPRPK